MRRMAMGKSKKIRRLNGNRQRLKEKQEQILEAYGLFDDDEISTERLLAMVADYTGCDIDDVVEAIYLKSLQNGEKEV